MYQKAVELAEANGWFLARQFETDGQRRDPRDDDGARDPRRLQGRAARLLRHRLRHRRHRDRRRRACCARERPETKIVLSEPANAQLLGSGKAQERAADGSPAVSHPAFEPHPIQGWTPDFIPLVLQEAVDKNYYDERDPDRRRRGRQVGARRWRRRRASSPASPAARPSPWRMQVAEKARARIGRSLACCPTPASAT